MFLKDLLHRIERKWGILFIPGIETGQRRGTNQKKKTTQVVDLLSISF